MGSLPDSKYIIQTDGYYFVESHDVDPSKGYITVSAKGVINGLSNQPNDGCDFGPDTYNPDYTGSRIPYTQTSGIQEAYNYLVKLNTYSTTTLTFIENSVPYIIGETIQIGPVVSITFSGSFGSDVNLIPAQGFNDPLINLGSVQANFVGITFEMKVGNYGVTSYTGPYLTNTNISSYVFDYHFLRCYWGANPTNGIFDFNSSNNMSRYVFIDCQIACSGSGMTNLFKIGSNGAYNDTPIIFISTDFSIPGVGADIGACQVYLSDCWQHSATPDNSSSTTSLFNITNTTSVPTFQVSGHTFMDSETLMDFSGVTNAGRIDILYLHGMQYIPNMLKNYVNNAVYQVSTLNNSNPRTSTNGIVAYIPIQIQANPPVSGTVYQNTNPYDILIYLPAYATTSGTAGSVAVAIGSSSTPSTTFTQFVSGSTSSSSPDTLQIKVPAGWYYEVTTTSVTLATATVVAD